MTNVDRPRPPPVGLGIQVDIEGPSEVRVRHREVGDRVEFAYVVTAEGEYSVAVVYADRIHIPGSPFRPKFSGKSPAVIVFDKTV